MNARREAIIAPPMPIVWMMFMASPVFVETDSSATEILVYVSVSVPVFLFGIPCVCGFLHYIC